MSSSESEDDCYSNVALKLQKMKNHYTEDKFETNNLLYDSNEVQNIVKTTSNVSSIDFDGSLSLVEDTIPSPSKKNIPVSAPTSEAEAPVSNKRVTRASKKKADSGSVADPDPVPKKTRKRTSKNSSTSVPNTDEIPVVNASTSTLISPAVQVAPVDVPALAVPSIAPIFRRGRGRGRGRTPRRSRTSRNLHHLVHAISSMLPIYSVGNTYEYPDQCETQELFSNKPKTNEEVVVVDDQDPLEVNEEVSVKVYWQNSEFFKFNIRQFQKLTQIFEYFSKKENVSQSNLLFMFNDKIITVNDTPDSINYNIGKFIDGGVVHKNISELTKKSNQEKIVNGLKIKFQCQSSKKPFETVIGADDKLSLALLKCAEHFEMPIDKLKFVFDGDTILGTNTPSDLEFEGGECIDVKLIS